MLGFPPFLSSLSLSADCVYFLSHFSARADAQCFALSAAGWLALACLFTVVRLRCESDENKANYDWFLLFRL